MAEQRTRVRVRGFDLALSRLRFFSSSSAMILFIGLVISFSDAFVLSLIGSGSTLGTVFHGLLFSDALEAEVAHGFLVLGPGPSGDDAIGTLSLILPKKHRLKIDKSHESEQSRRSTFHLSPLPLRDFPKRFRSFRRFWRAS